MTRWLLAVLVALAAQAVAADESIRRYDIDIAIEASGAIEVTEHITAQVEGNQIRRGIYRDFPTRYRDRFGNRVVVGLEVLGVERNGQPEPWFTEKVSNGVRINTGNDDYLPAPAQHTFTIRYRTTRQIGFFADHDELYWNAIGTGWVFPIEQASVDARLPVAVPAQQLSVEAYTGPQGAKGTAYNATVRGDGQAHWELTSPLAPREGMTIVLTFPKGVIQPPSTPRRVLWFFTDNAGALIAVLGLIALIVFCVREWQRVGRDPRKGIIIARYEPPDGHTPASLRFVQHMGYDTRCFSAAVLNLAVAGCLRIVREPKMLKDEWRLERAEQPPPANAAEGALLEKLFKSSNELVLKKSNATTMQSALAAHARVLKSASQPRYFELNGWSIAKAVGIAVLGFVIALMVSQGAGMIVVLGCAALSAITLIVFGVLIRAPTVDGRKLMDEIEGLKLYLSVAERDELARVSGPELPPTLDAQRYERLLPYAVALEVEEAWTKKFTLAVGAAAAAATANNIAWYRGGHVGNLTNLTQAVGSSLSSQIASASTPPGSSSGSGGGGSSGGGGGGGGGGGR